MNEFNLAEINPTVSRVKVKIAYFGKNKRKFDFTKKVLEDMIPSLKGTPIVAYYSKKNNQLGGHKNDLIKTKNGLMRTGETQAYGFVCPVTDPFWVKTKEKDGQEHEYLTTYGYLWKERYPKETDLIEKSDQSMEIYIIDANMIDGYIAPIKSQFLGLCALNGISPTYESSNFEKFSDLNLSEQIGHMYELISEVVGFAKDESKSTPAKENEKIKGSEKNKPNSASTEGKNIKLNENIIKSLKNKLKEHNEDIDNELDKKVTLNDLKKVYRRGAGAYSTSHRPNVTSRNQWAMGRVNAFLYLLKNGKPKDKDYVADNDLLPKSHPKNKSVKMSYYDSILNFIDETLEGDYEYFFNEFKSTVEEFTNFNFSNDITNFPKKGDNKKVSLRNSNYPLFDKQYAENLKNKFSKIWKKGGNILGNTQYNRLVKILKQNGEVKTPTDEKAIRLREAWMARHYKDKLIAGVVAQIKWLGIGSRGEKYMKDLVNEEKKKLKDSFSTNSDLMNLFESSVSSIDQLEDGRAKYWFLDCDESYVYVEDVSTRCDYRVPYKIDNGKPILDLKEIEKVYKKTSYELFTVDKGVNDSIEVSVDGDEAIKGNVGEKNINAMKRKIVMAKNYKEIIPKIFARYPKNLDDFNLSDIGYPLMSEKDGIFYYNTGFIKAASSRIEQNKKESYYNQVRDRITEAREKVGMKKEFSMKGDVSFMDNGMMKNMYAKYGMDRYMFAKKDEGYMYAMDMEEMKPMKMAYKMMEEGMAVPETDKMEMAQDMFDKEDLMRIAKAMYDMYMDKKHGYMSLEQEKETAFSENKCLKEKVDALQDSMKEFALKNNKNEAEKIMGHKDFSILTDEDKKELAKDITNETNMEDFKVKVESFAFKKEKSNNFKKKEDFSMGILSKNNGNENEEVDIYKKIRKKYNI